MSLCQQLYSWYIDKQSCRIYIEIYLWQWNGMLLLFLLFFILEDNSIGLWFKYSNFKCSFICFVSLFFYFVFSVCIECILNGILLCIKKMKGFLCSSNNPFQGQNNFFYMTCVGLSSDLNIIIKSNQ